jgi:hypothetical protein
MSRLHLTLDPSSLHVAHANNTLIVKVSFQTDKEEQTCALCNFEIHLLIMTK